MERSGRHENNVICGRVTDSGGTKGPVRNAEVVLSVVQTTPGTESDDSKKKSTQRFEMRDPKKALTDDDGLFRFEHLDASLTYQVAASAFNQTSEPQTVTITPGCETTVAPITFNLGLDLDMF